MQISTVFFVEKRTSNVKGLIRILFRFLLLSLIFFALVFLFIVYVLCAVAAVVSVDKYSKMYVCGSKLSERERKGTSKQSARTHTAGKKNMKIESVRCVHLSVLLS